MSAWRPIKSAPRDGTTILVAEPHPGGSDNPPWVTAARWVDCPQDAARMEPSQIDPGWYAAYIAFYSGGEHGRA